jgi:Cu/Ag efflux pump CusA
MLQALVNWSLKNRFVVAGLAALLLAAGFWATGRARLDVFPEFAPPQVVVQTEAPGLSASEVEQLVTLPVENAVNGVPQLDVLRSQSTQGLSLVIAVFKDGADLFRARQQVSERLAELGGQFPSGVKPPRLAPLTSVTGRLLTIGLTARPLTAADYSSALAPPGPGGLGQLPWAGLFLAARRDAVRPDAFDLRDAAQWAVRPRLLAVRGVAQVTIFGGAVRQFQVQVDPEALAARGLTFTDVAEAARQATGVRSGGFVENERQRLTLRVEAQTNTLSELAATVVASPGGTPVRLGDVARVAEGPEPRFGAAAVNGRPGVALIVYKQFDADTLQVTRDVEAELERLAPGLRAQGIEYHPALFRQASFIEQSVGNVQQALLLGAALVCAVLLLFLGELREALIAALAVAAALAALALALRLFGLPTPGWAYAAAAFVVLLGLAAFLPGLRVAFISLTAIPLSLLGAVLVLGGLGVSLNTLTLGGLAIAVGEVVDDAIIDVENIHRRLAENARLARPLPAAQVVLAASMEVRGSVVYATFIVALVFLPVLFLSGLQGRLFAPLAYAYILAVMASLAVALTVSPALALILLARGKVPIRKGEEEHVPWLLRLLRGGYDRLLRLLDRHGTLVLATASVMVAAGGWLLSRCGGQYLPELREAHFVVHMRGLPGASLDQSLAVGRRVTQALREIPGVRNVTQQAGRAELGEDTWGVEYSELEVDLTPQAAADIAQTERAIRRRLEDFPGYGFEVLPFLSERIKETLSGSTAPVVVKATGDRLDDLETATQQIADALRGVRGSQEVRAEAQTGAPELVVRPRRADLGRFGLRAGQVLDAVHAAYQGAEVGQVYDRNRVIDVVVLLEPRARNDAERVGELWLRVPPDAAPEATDSGAGRGRVRLSRVADVFLTDGRFMVAHEGGLRQQRVTCRVKEGADPAAFERQAQEAVARLRLPPGVTAAFAGELEARRTAVWELLWLSLAAAAGIVLLLWLALGSLKLVGLVLLNVPFALVGGVAAVYLAGGLLDVGGVIGFVTLFGITMRNGIMMASHWRHLHEVEGMAWGPELVYRGARERLAPVLMTALVTGLGLLPIALGSGEAGREIEGPMALVILGGLVTSTALNLLVLPLAYRRLGR